MRPLADWQPDALELSVNEFCARHVHPFLVHCQTTSPLRGVDKTHGLTIDRLVLSDRRSDNQAWSSLVGDYAAFEVRARHADRTVDITVGCSSACDIRIDDTSISKLHAVMQRDADGWHVRDASSLIGIRVNDDEHYTEPLCSGDRISFGAVDMIFLLPREVHQLLRRLQPHQN